MYGRHASPNRPVRQAISIDDLCASPWIGFYYRHEFLLRHRHESLESPPRSEALASPNSATGRCGPKSCPMSGLVGYLPTTRTPVRGALSDRGRDVTDGAPACRPGFAAADCLRPVLTPLLRPCSHTNLAHDALQSGGTECCNR